MPVFKPMFALTATLACLMQPAHAETTPRASAIKSLKLISTLANGTKGNNHTGTYGVVDANRVAVWSRASNFPKPVANHDQLYIKNITTGSLKIVSTNEKGEPANNYNQFPSFSATGDVMSFTTAGTNMFPKDTNATSDIVVKNLKTGKIKVASSNSKGQLANGLSESSQISRNGNHVYFYSMATNLVSGDTNKVSDIFMKNLVTGQTKRVSTNSSGKMLNSWTSGFYVTDDEKYLYFVSDATNIDQKPAKKYYDIFKKNLVTGKVVRVSLTSTGKAINGHSFLESVARDGSKITFVSYGTNLPGGNAEYGQIYVKDLKTGKVTLVSRSASGTPANEDCWNSSFSPDGTRVMFQTQSTNLIARKDTNESSDIYVKDLKTGAISLISSTLSGEFGNGGNGHRPFWMPNGKSIVYETSSTNLNPKDKDINILDLYIAVLK